MVYWRSFALTAVVLSCLHVPAAYSAEPVANSVRVAGIVLKWIRGDKAANYRRAEPMIRAASAGGAKIVCTTECFLDGYAIADKSIPLETYRALGEPIPGGPYFERLSRLADELDVHLIAGMLEADGEARYNTAVLIDPEGKLAGKYRKQKLQHELVRNTPGTESSVFGTPYGQVGIMICADRTEPTIVRNFCTRGADFLICPSGGMFGPKSNDPIVRSRSRENGKYIVFVHPAEFLVTDPQGEMLANEVVGDMLLIDPAQQGTDADKNVVRYFDLPLAESKPNAVGNGDFSVWEGYTGKGVTTTSVGVPAKSIPEHWYGGPGHGATATYDVVAFPPDQTEVPGHPKQFLRVAWSAPPAEGWTEAHHKPDTRFTFLENFSISDVRRFAGQTVVFSFYGRVASGTTDVIPILWHSYDSATPGIVAVKGKGYELFEASGQPGVVAVAQGKPRPEAICQLTDRWQRFEKRITLPATEGRSITAGHYTGVGFDLHVRSAPTIDLANVEIRSLAEPSK